MKRVLWLCLGCVLATAVQAQGYEELAVRYSRPQLYYEAVALPSAEGSILIVSFRIPNRMLVFMRNQRAVSGRAFIAEPEVTVQVRRDDRIIHERVWRQPHYAATFEETNDREADLEGQVHFDLEPGTYTYHLSFKDRQAERSETFDPRTVTVPDEGALRVEEAIVARSVYVHENSVTVELANLGSDIPYGQPAHAVVPVTGPDTLRRDDLRLRYTLRRLEDRRAERTIRADTMDGASLVSVQQIQAAADSIQWTTGSPSGDGGRYLAIIDVNGPQLEDGTYTLDVTASIGAHTAQQQTRFETHWRDMPFSLYDLDVAIENLEFIEGRATVRAMRKGSADEQEERFRSYWRQRDPTPETAFNELMDEYYRRIDHAAFEFRTGQATAPDGLRTDRAEVYIVHGPPDDVERTLPSSGGVEEVWTYRDGRQFVFWAATSLDPFALRERVTR